MKPMGNIYGCAECKDSFSTSKSLVSHVQNKHQLLRIDNNKKKLKDLIFQNISLDEKSKKVANDKQNNFSVYEIETSNKPIVIPDSATIQNLEKYFDKIKVIHTNIEFETLNPRVVETPEAQPLNSRSMTHSPKVSIPLALVFHSVLFVS